MSEDYPNKQEHNQQHACTADSGLAHEKLVDNLTEESVDSTQKEKQEGCSETQLSGDCQLSESSFSEIDKDANTHTNELINCSDEIVSKAETRRKCLKRGKKCRRETFFLRRILIDLRLDDYRNLSWRERLIHFFWLLGVDRFPFRERGWIFIFLTFVIMIGSLWASDPTKWEVYRKWRASKHFNQAVVALKSGYKNTAQMHLRNAYRHTPDDIKILEKLLETIPKTESMSRISILLEIMNIRPSGETAAAIIEELLSMKNVTEAASFVSRQLTFYPDSAKLWFAAGKTYLMQKRYDVALEALEHAKKLLPEDKQINFHLNLVQILASPVGELPDFSALESYLKIPELRQVAIQALSNIHLSFNSDKAVSFLETILAENPDEWEFQFLKFRMQLEKSPDKKAEHLWENIWSRAVTLETRLNVIFEAIRHDLRELAESLCSRLSVEERKKASFLWVKILTHINYKEWQLAHSIAIEALKNDKLSPDWQLRFLAGLALVYQQMGNNQESTICYNEAARRVRNDRRLHFFLSELLLGLNLQDYARDSYEQLASIESPYRETALQRLLGIYKSQLDWASTHKTLERLHTLDVADNKYIIEHASMLLVDRKINHPVISSLIRGDLENLPLENDALELMAHAYAQVGNLSKASYILQQLEKRQPPNFRPNIHRIATLAYLGKKDAAASAYAQMLNEHIYIHEREKKYLEEILTN